MGKVEKRFGVKLASLKDLFDAVKRSHDYFAERHCVARSPT